MTQRLKQLLLSAMLLMGVVLAPAVNAEGIKVKFFELERVETEWFLNAAFQIELSPGLEDAIQKGVVLHFQTEFELTRSRWYWFDERPVLALRQTRLSYQLSALNEAVPHCLWRTYFHGANHCRGIAGRWEYWGLACN
jgi:hypothetical protein